MFFKILWVTDAIASLVVFYFFFAGLADGTVSSRNAGLWTVIILILGGIMAGSIWLKTHGYSIPAFILLCVHALPAFFFVLYMLVIICSGSSFR